MQCDDGTARSQVVDRPPLSPRERQILAMVVLDFSNAEIASKLFVSESNVKNHLSSAFQKLGVKSRSRREEAVINRKKAAPRTRNPADLPGGGPTGDRLSSIWKNHRSALDVACQSMRPRRPMERVRLAREIVAAYLQARRELRRAPIESVVAALRSEASPPPLAPGPHALEEARRLGWTVARTLKLMPGDTRCLARSLVLTRLLARRGSPPSS